MSEETVRAVLNGTTTRAIIGENPALQGLHAFAYDPDALALLLPLNQPMARIGTLTFEQAIALDLVALPARHH